MEEKKRPGSRQPLQERWRIRPYLSLFAFIWTSLGLFIWEQGCGGVPLMLVRVFKWYAQIIQVSCICFYQAVRPGVQGVQEGR